MTRPNYPVTECIYFRLYGCSVHIGMVDAYRGALSCLFTEIVHNGVFYFVGYELGVTELVRENHSVYGKTFIFIQEVFPRNGLDSFVNFIGILRLKMFDGFQDADGSTQAEVCLYIISLSPVKATMRLPTSILLAPSSVSSFASTSSSPWKVLAISSNSSFILNDNYVISIDGTNLMIFCLLINYLEN